MFFSSSVALVEVLNEVRELRRDLVNIELRKLRQDLDCWHSNSRTAYESTFFKDNLATFYGCSRATDTDLKCMLTGTFYARNEVRASHIIKRSTDGDTMHLYGLPADIDNVRNGLLLLEPIEQAFDRKDICFVHNSFTKELVAKVLNPNLITEQMRPQRGPCYGRTFGSIDGQALQLPPNMFPYRRALNMHAKFAYSRALHLHWITNEVTLDSYFNLSDAGLEEPLGLGHLTWQHVHSTIHNVV